MERQPVESSSLASIGYDSETSKLEVEFKSGDIWQYFDVPESVWHEFESSESKGRFFALEIRGQYSESQVG